MSLLREQLLDGHEIALAGAVRGTVRAALSRAGASLHELAADLDEDSAAEWAGTRAPIHALVLVAAFLHTS
jgi:hypothetical protein